MAENLGPGAAPQEVSVTVPPGDYSAVGKAEAMNETAPGSTPTAGMAKCVLVSSDDSAIDTSRSSVPADGGAEGPGGTIGLGAAALTDLMTFHLPNGGFITESCSHDPSSLSDLRFEHLTVVATRVAAAHP